MVCEAFAEGCAGDLLFDARALRGGVAVFYGIGPGMEHLWRQCLAEGRPYIYIDNGYFGRGEFFSATVNALRHDGTGRPDFDRLAARRVSIWPWRKSGRHIVVCPQSDWFHRLHTRRGRDTWVERTVATLRAVTTRDICVRLKDDATPLARDLDGAHALVTFTSNAAVEAVCAGVPVITTGACAARTMGSASLFEIESPAFPGGRTRWAACLAANQWTLQEMREGRCWSVLRERTRTA